MHEEGAHHEAAAESSTGGPETETGLGPRGEAGPMGSTCAEKPPASQICRELAETLSLSASVTMCPRACLTLLGLKASKPTMKEKKNTHSSVKVRCFDTHVTELLLENFVASDDTLLF